MADAPKLLPTDKLREGYPKINLAIDNANEALKEVVKPITTAKIQDEAVTTGKIGKESVTTEKIKPESVTTGVMADKSITAIKMDEKAVELSHLLAPVAYIEPSRNLIDPKKLKTGYFIGFGTGNENANASYSATEFILIKPNTAYALSPSDQLAFYDKQKKFISGLGDISARSVFTSPANAFYIRVSVKNTNISTVQLEEGSFNTLRQAYKSPTTIEKIIMEDKLTDLLHHIENPFVKTKLKLIGDSITAGVGGTGYSVTGEFMFKDSGGADRYANIETATCWANSLKKYLETKYNKEVSVDLSHPAIKAYSYDCKYMEYDNLAFVGYQWYFPNKQPGTTMLEFEFYGDHFAINLSKSSVGGIFDVYVDDVKVQSIDCYNATSQSVEVPVSGLSLANHKVKFIETNSKNASSTSYSVYVQGLKIPKTVIVKNWGISGRQSRHLTFDKDKWVQDDDDFILLQMGTNDRMRAPEGYTREHQRNFIQYVRSLGKKIIIMASIPATAAHEASGTYYAQMSDIQNRIHDLAHEMKVPFISNYHFFVDYLMLTGVSLDSLLADQLHPNDLGYKLMYKNIMKHLGFAIKVDEI
ncbi:SGNH/GDSL hydrolase family protein [Bacillus mycoides]|uniref:SGNH/GDSL hydrolase family protein n=1 Tax=Bacillus mycoides TaxID=1405 RepID=UPI0011A80D4E|nr:SGNH/GDSL hydrolase family protein [Bacillus mycoides]